MQLALWRCGREAHPARMGAALQPFDEMPNEPWVHETKNNEDWIVLDFLVHLNLPSQLLLLISEYVNLKHHLQLMLSVDYYSNKEENKHPFTKVTNTLHKHR